MVVIILLLSYFWILNNTEIIYLSKQSYNLITLIIVSVNILQRQYIVSFKLCCQNKFSLLKFLYLLLNIIHTLTFQFGRSLQTNYLKYFSSVFREVVKSTIVFYTILLVFNIICPSKLHSGIKVLINWLLNNQQSINSDDWQ